MVCPVSNDLLKFWNSFYKLVVLDPTGLELAEVVRVFDLDLERVTLLFL